MWKTGMVRMCFWRLWTTLTVLVLPERLCVLAVWAVFSCQFLLWMQAWNSVSPVGTLTNPKPLGLALLSGPRQYNLFVFCDCHIHLLPDMQQWKIKRPSTDKLSLRAATFPLLRQVGLQWGFTSGGLKILWPAHVTWKAAHRSLVALHCVTSSCWPLWHRPRVSWHVVLALGWGAGRRQGQ